MRVKKRQKQKKCNGNTLLFNNKRMECEALIMSILGIVELSPTALSASFFPKVAFLNQ